MLRIFYLVVVMAALSAKDALACMPKHSSDDSFEAFGSLLAGAAFYAALFVVFKAIFYAGRIKIRSYLNIWLAHVVIMAFYGAVIAVFTFPRPSKMYDESNRILGGTVAKIFDLNFININPPLSLIDFICGILFVASFASILPVCAYRFEIRLLKGRNKDGHVARNADVIGTNIALGLLLAAVVAVNAISEMVKPC